MTSRQRRLTPGTRRAIARAFAGLDYHALGAIYCEFGGDAFWKARRGPCRQLGLTLGTALLRRLRRGGRSLYIGAGVAEIPMLAVEACELGREVEPCNLRSNEVELLNAACGALPFRFKSAPSSTAKGKGKGKGRFDHVWIVSVLNDPEKYPELSALSYGRANPVMFDPRSFERERKIVKRLAASCLGKLSIPGLVSTSVEEIPWIIDWCARAGIRYRVEQHTYPAALVGDPVCFIRVG